MYMYLCNAKYVDVLVHDCMMGFLMNYFEQCIQPGTSRIPSNSKTTNTSESPTNNLTSSKSEETHKKNSTDLCRRL